MYVTEKSESLTNMETLTPTNSVFLLGGHDLEMDTIKGILLRMSFRVEDHNLTWADANLSAYKGSLDEEKNSGRYIIGVELKNDIVFNESNYLDIDHHGDSVNKGSSLEQIADRIGYSLTFDERLVAANDEGYVPALKELLKDMDNEEQLRIIREIRRKDRKAQGISEAEERTADSEIENAYALSNGVVFLKTSLNHFSPIADRLYELFPYCSHVIYNDFEICTYGEISKAFKDYYKGFDNFYSGGVSTGFAGISGVNNGDIGAILKQIKKMRPISKHVFLFPFRYCDDWNKLDVSSIWKRLFEAKDEADQAALFNEKQYFYPYVHDVLYDKGGASSRIRHYERDSHDEQYVITVNGRDFKLDIEAVHLNLYDFGLGVLSFHLLNTDELQSSPDDILRINQYGRRLMPPFYNEISKNKPRAELADKIAIINKNGKEIVSDDFSWYVHTDTWRAGKVVEHLISPLAFRPVIDDRMFTLCYYQNSHEMERIAKAAPQSTSFCRNCYNHGEACPDFWYKYVFVDGGDATCYGDDLFKELVKKQTYSRWEHPLWGTEYGVSRYSMVALTTETAPSFLLDYFETIYTRLAELVLCQRAGLVIFSDRVRNVSGRDEPARLAQEYVHFSNHFCINEITSQDQGCELYSLMRETLRIEQYEASLREQILQLNEQMLAKSNVIREKNSYNLNMLAWIMVPVSTIATITGLFQLCSDRFSLSDVGWIIVIVLGLGTLLTLVMWNLFINKEK